MDYIVYTKYGFVAVSWVNSAKEAKALVEKYLDQPNEVTDKIHECRTQYDKEIHRSCLTSGKAVMPDMKWNPAEFIRI